MRTFFNHILSFRQNARYLVGCLLLLLTSFGLKAQVYPVQVNTIIIPPYSPYTSDYTSSANDKMIVNLLLRDINASNVQVKLRVNIEGQGVKLSTNPQANVPILTLDGGVPERLTGTDLEPYFRAENLNFAGLDANTYRQQGGKLPEGLYRICFDVYELKTGAKLSIASGCANAWIVLNDPPVINFPENNARVAVRDPQYITFQWTPRHKGSPNSAFTTEYELELVELMPGFNYNPQAGFLAGKPLYSTTTMNTMLVYGPGEPLLESGRTYAFRVRAKSLVAAQEMDLFKNNGYSEIFSFVYQGSCAVPQNQDAEAKGSTRAAISWNPGTANQQEFVVSYRKANTPDAAWFEEKTNANSLTLIELNPATAYEYKVRCNCADGGQSTFTDVRTVTTAADELAETAYNCGVIPAEVDISNQEPLPAIRARDMFMAGDFPVKILEVQGANGNYSGKGYIGIPYLKGGQVSVMFNNIFINTDYRMVKGQVVTEYDASWNGINNLDDTFEGGGNTGNVVSGTDTADVVLDVVVDKPEDIKATPNTDADGNPAPGGTLTVTGSNGETVTKTVDKLPATVKDAAGNIYKVDEKGQVTQVAKGGGASALPPAGQLNQLHPDKAVVRFTGHPDAKYAFDAWDPVYAKSQIFGAEYEKLSDDYRVSAKAVAAGQTDVVTAEVELHDNTIVADSIKFITGKGSQFLSESIGNNRYKVSIVGGPADDAQELFAIYKPANGQSITLGKLKIAAYGQKQRKLVLVPVNGNPGDAAGIAATLNKVYDSIGIHWDVSVDQTFTNMSWDLDGDRQLNASGSGLFSTLTDEMKALNNAYIQDRKPDNSTVYLFVLSNGKGKEGALAGDMPRDHQFGYLFTDGSSDLGLTAAHELGHGIFNLKHTFDGYGFGAGDLADNVMNYNDGQRLTKFQWDAAHNPGIVWGVFQSDADAGLLNTKMILVSDYKLPGITDADYIVNGNINYVAPNGKIIALPKDVKVSFGGYVMVAGSGNASSISKDAIGVVTGFTKDNKQWLARYESGDFTGYYENADNTKAKYEFTDVGGTQLIVAGIEYSKCKLAFYAGRYQSQAIKYTDFKEIKVVDDLRKLVGVKQIEGQVCIDCTIPMESKPTEIQTLLGELARDPNSSTLDDKMGGISEENLKNFLCVSERVALIRNIADGFLVGNDDEMSIVKLIRSTPDDQVKQVLDTFRLDNTGLLALLFKNIDGAELEEYFSAMSQLFFRSKTEFEWQAEFDAFDTRLAAFQETLSKDDCNYYYKWADQGLMVTKAAYYDEAGSIKNDVKYQFTPWANLFGQDGKVSISYTARNPNCGMINLSDPFNLGHSYQSEPFRLLRIFSEEADGTRVDAYVPAMYMAYITSNYEKYAIMNAVNKLIAVLAAKQLGTKGASFWTYLFATIDLVVANGNLYIADNQAMLAKTESGKKFLEKWEAANKYIMIAQGIRLFYGIGVKYVEFKLAVDELKTAYQEWKFKDFAELKAKNPELAAKLEAFGAAGLKKLDDLIADYELKVADVMAIVKCPREVAERILANEGHLFIHVPTSGAKILYNAKQGTFLVGSFNADLKEILEELNYPVETNAMAVAPASNPQFLTAAGQRFNLLNVSEDVVRSFTKKGGFFDNVNAKWVDAAVAQKADVIIVSSFRNLYTLRKGKNVLTGFGKEVHRFEWKHGWRFDPETNMMVAPGSPNFSKLMPVTKFEDNLLIDINK
ncbi:hypothetical protein F0L74_11015 [Chitinophaga agrisoli]|uniref:Fibronectin type-III domain-containing protein n=1 Tax=Chitinophaga agrisoli TaxID=2607653 RepID=A0A5B2VXJ8_9BACT|nr:fibronectin type III domain-containing protein [Chitinophaga agrisoli]KAA2243042.1 hypothetical protein F0L74_11015 [Chitinophaga agrisoli]